MEETEADAPHRSAVGGRERWDVVVVGGGNAGFCAAHAARERGARVLLLEKAGKAEAGGNSFYTAGAFRFAHGGLAELRRALPELSEEKSREIDLPTYSADDFMADMKRLTNGQTDPVLSERLVADSFTAVRWLAGKGFRWRLMYERQAYLSGERYVFFGGVAVGAVGGGKGLMESQTELAARTGVEIRYRAEVTALQRCGCGVNGVTYCDPSGEHTVEAGAVVLAAGGFEASPARRARYLGEQWSRAAVRGTPSNTGEVLEAALKIGAAGHGDWASCHSVAWDSNAAPTGGNRQLTNQLTRQSYPLGIVVNKAGQRFLDEGADYRNYTYAKYGREILGQPDGVAFQLYDTKTRPLLRSEEYDSTPITGAKADSLQELAARLGIEPQGLKRTVQEFNSSINDVPFDPAVKDGRAAAVDPPKSNWALALDTPPYYGYAVTCGITFTFGGLRIDRDAHVLGSDGRPIPGLYAAGELVGGLFYDNYPGGSGLTSGAVFGRLAGYGAADEAQQAH